MTPPRPEFGTDGLRGRAGDFPLDPETLARVGAALGLWLQRTGPETKRLVVGDDGRASSGWIRDALARGLAAMEVVVADAGLITTPALAHLTADGPYAAGIMISASHNPAHDNGIKVFDGTGAKLGPDDETRIADWTLEVELDDEATTPRIKPVPEPVLGYEERLANAFPGLAIDGVRLVVDAAHGGGSRLVPGFLRALGADVVEVGCSPDGENINAGVGALHPEVAAAAVREHGARLGICLDGDGDRGIFVDETGTVRDGDEVLALLAPRLRARGQLPGDTVVATVMSNLGLRRRLTDEGIALRETPVGDRHVVATMRAEGFGLGGEQSGHILFGGPGRLTGDGLFTALMLLAESDLLASGYAAAFDAFQRFPQELINVTVASKPPLADQAEVQAALREVEAALGADGRVLLRYSGTEPLCRVMVEGPDTETVHAHATRLADVVREALA